MYFFNKKDIRRSFDTIKNEHEQLICAFEIRPRYATALRHGSNHLSGAKVDDFSELNKKLDRKIKEWQKKGLSVQDIFLFISLELRFRPSKKNDKYHSFYLGLFENKQKYTIRISDHHLDATNDLLKDEKNNNIETAVLRITPEHGLYINYEYMEKSILRRTLRCKF